jgi:hypothetical protein
MSEVWYSITEKTLTDMANAVRGKVGETGKMTPSEMAATLEALNITLQEKEVTPTAEEQTVTADEGYYGLSSVTVKAVESSGELVLPEGVGIYYIGKANSVLSLNFESSAVGTLTE